MKALRLNQTGNVLQAQNKDLKEATKICRAAELVDWEMNMRHSGSRRKNIFFFESPVSQYYKLLSIS